MSQNRQEKPQGRYRQICLLVVLLLGPGSERALAWGVSASIGSQVPQGAYTDFALDFSSHLWWHHDAMVLLGIGSGVIRVNEEQKVPIFSSIFIRLPIGAQILPIVSGDWGYAINDGPGRFVWRAGGGLDIKNGDRSSLLVQGGYKWWQGLGNYFYLRAGLLLEY